MIIILTILNIEINPSAGPGREDRLGVRLRPHPGRDPHDKRGP